MTLSQTRLRPTARSILLLNFITAKTERMRQTKTKLIMLPFLSMITEGLEEFIHAGIKFNFIFRFTKTMTFVLLNQPRVILVFFD